jgi:pimeloyl-ACP methyl ester carboxylesterase
MTWLAKAATIPSGRMTFLEAGDRSSPHVLVLIHAFPVGMRMWEAFAVPDGWRALAPALPGFDGADAPPDGSTRLDDYARVVLELLDHLRIESAVLGGLSMGGYVSFALWRMARFRWRALVLADTRAGADTEAARAAREVMLEIVRTRGARGVADEMIPKLLGRTTRAEQPQLVDHVRRLTERQTDQALAAATVRLRDRPDSTSLLAEIGVPALVLVGDEDEITPPAEAERLSTTLADARLVRLPGAGHLSVLEKPAAFHAAVDDFLTRIRG